MVVSGSGGSGGSGGGLQERLRILVAPVADR
jgi:hypothetical protein